MGPQSDQTPSTSEKCTKCGAENPPGRVFCRSCRHRLPAARSDEPVVTTPVAPPVPVQSDAARLQLAQAENQDLKNQLQSLQEELGKLKEASKPQDPPDAVLADLHTKLNSAEDKGAKLEAQSSEWQKKWKSAEDKAASIEQQLSAKVKELEAAFQKHSDAQPLPVSDAKPQSGNRMTIIAAILAAVGGYGAGRYVQPVDNSSGKVNQLSAQVTSAQDQIGNLKGLLDAANKKAAQIESDSKAQVDTLTQKVGGLTNSLSAREGQLHQAEAKLAAAQHDLAANDTRLNTSIAKEHTTDGLAAQRQTQLTAANQRILQLEKEVRSRDTDIASLRTRLANAPPLAPSRAGNLVWTGATSGKRKVDIQNGHADWGLASGALPRVPCTVSSPDNVQFKTRPSEKNQWNRVAFEVSGNGSPMQVRISCVPTQ